MDDLFGQNESGDQADAAVASGRGARKRDGRASHDSGSQPLADRMRPRDFAEWVGQRETAGEGSPLRRFIAQGKVPSLLLWGPPGCGKTTLARVIAAETGLHLQQLSAVTSGVKEVKETIALARRRLTSGGGATILFIDEIHRFNKAQQDALLPHVEDGTIVFIGATTENPSFSVISPLLSRCRVLTLSALSVEELVIVLRRALEDAERGLGAAGIDVEAGALDKIAHLSDGDARRALNMLEQCAIALGVVQAEAHGAIARPIGAPPRLTTELLAELVRRDRLFYDRAGEEHFNVISAFHKSLRASDPQAALYWMARMILSGEDPLYIARRMIACASEDVGLADPQAMTQALAAYQAFQVQGLPEGELNLVQAAVYIATAPKSNAVVKALHAAHEAVEREGPLPAPLHLRNAPTGLMKGLGYGREYQYDHDAPDHYSGQPCLPEKLRGAAFYEPGEFGFEKEIRKRLDWWAEKRRERGGAT
jgi:putative ATPase